MKRAQSISRLYVTTRLPVHYLLMYGVTLSGSRGDEAHVDVPESVSKVD